MEMQILHTSIGHTSLAMSARRLFFFPLVKYLNQYENSCGVATSDKDGYVNIIVSAIYADFTC